MTYLNIQIPPTGYVGLIWRSMAEATASLSTVEGALTVRSRCYCMQGTPVTVFPQSTLNGTPICSNPSGTASYETCVAGQEESGCVSRKSRHQNSYNIPAEWKLNPGSLAT